MTMRCNRCRRELEVRAYPPDEETVLRAEDRGVEVFPRYRMECPMHRNNTSPRPTGLRKETA